MNPKFRSIIGLRGEKYFTHYTGQDSSGDREFKGEKVTDTFDLFPSSNFIFSVTETICHNFERAIPGITA